MGSVYDDLKEKYGTFSLVVCLEVAPVILHPRVLANTILSLTARGGLAIVTTGYHGYWKNLALALTGKMDQHFTVLWENGLIKFYSVATFAQLFRESGASKIDIELAGRIPAFAKSIVATVRP